MIETTQTSLDALVSPSREIKAKIDLFDGTTKKATFTGSDKIKKFQIERAGEEGKFFGFGVSQKLELELLDKNRELNIVKGNTFDVYLTADTTYTKILSCEVDSIKRDEKTNGLTITAYDALYRASGHQVKDLTLTTPYTIKQFCEACGAKLGVSVKGINTFTLSYPNGANFDGAETLREALDMVAEATQTIYFMDSTNALVFKKLNKAGANLLTIDKNIYFEYKNNGPRVLKTICSTNELGDDVSESGTTGDATQFVRDNAFWELREDITDLVHNAVVAVGGLSISQFECKWRGNFFLEIGDKIQILGKDNSSAITYLLNDTLVYNGGLNQTSSWKYKDSGETASNPTNLGEAIKQTYAKVDKQNKEITLLASEVKTQTEAIKKTVKQVDVEYYLSTSSSTPTGGTWSTEAPPWEENKYMWSRQKDTGKTMAEIFMLCGVPILRADNNRVQGHLQVHEALADMPDGKPGLLFFNTCKETTADIEDIQADERNPNDCAKEPHEVTHCVDMVRYYCISRTMRADALRQTEQDVEDEDDGSEDYETFMTGGEPGEDYVNF